MTRSSSSSRGRRHLQRPSASGAGTMRSRRSSANNSSCPCLGAGRCSSPNARRAASTCAAGPDNPVTGRPECSTTARATARDVHRRLDEQHSVPAVRHHGDDAVADKRGHVIGLERLSVVLEPLHPGVRAEEHREVGMQTEKGFERGLVAVAQWTDQIRVRPSGEAEQPYDAPRSAWTSSTGLACRFLVCECDVAKLRRCFDHVKKYGLASGRAAIWCTVISSRRAEQRVACYY